MNSVKRAFQTGLILASVSIYLHPVFSMDMGELEAEYQTLYRQVSPTVVRLWSEQYVGLTTGVLVAPSGLVLSPYHPDFVLHKQEGKDIFVSFGSGRKVEGELVGWSSAWNLALFKLRNAGPWPHTKLSRPDALGLGKFVVGFQHQAIASRTMEIKPHMQNGIVTHLGQTWFTTTPVHGIIFNLNGELVGVSGLGFNHCRANVIREYLEKLVAGDLDAVHLDQSVFMDLLTEKPVDDTEDHLRKAAHDIASASTVRLRADANQLGWSGVVVSPAGHIATCAHIDVISGESVSVEFSDGSDAQADVLGVNRITDLALLKTRGDASYTYARLGDSTELPNGARCLLAGFPADHQSRTPSVQETEIVETSWYPRSSFLWTTRETRVLGGHSGGGVFDTEGRLVAIHLGNSGFAKRNMRVEAFKNQLKELVRARQDKRLSSIDLQELSTRFPIDDKAANLDAVVEIWQNGQRRALGTVVSEDGLVVTKSSLLADGPVMCQFKNGDTYQASIEKMSRENDLALLKIAARELSSVQWSKSDGVAEGSLVCVPQDVPDFRFGIISLGSREIPGQPTAGIINVKNIPEGVQFVDNDWKKEFPWIDPSSFPLVDGDIIQLVDGHPIANLESLESLLGGKTSTGRLNMNSGDVVKLKIIREQEEQFVNYQVPSPYYPDRDVSKRRYGFRAVFDIDVDCSPSECGAPVLNSSSEAIGIAIARPRRGQTHVIPARVIEDFISGRSNQ